MQNSPILVGVIGSGRADARLKELAGRVGDEIARRGWWLVCGGLGGAMEAACRGAREAGGHTIGILPGSDPNGANPWVEIPIVTGMADARNVIIARTARACIAVGGEFGTLSEIAFCLKFGTPVVAVESRWIGAGHFPLLPSAESAAEAVDWVQRQLA